jgi:hypothetical protein
VKAGPALTIVALTVAYAAGVLTAAGADPDAAPPDPSGHGPPVPPAASNLIDVAELEAANLRELEAAPIITAWIIANTPPPPPPPPPPPDPEPPPIAQRSESGSGSGAPRPAPSSPTGAPGGDIWYQLAVCESGANPATNTGNGYYGAFQFLASTWWSVGGTGLPHEHSYETQRHFAQILQARSGWGQWPACARKLGLV